MMAKNETKAAEYTTELAEDIANDAMNKADIMFSELMGYIAKGNFTNAFVPSVQAEFEQQDQTTETTEAAPAEETATETTETTTEAAPAAETTATAAE